MRFPEGFMWGAATSAYQIEGAVREGGRGESIWDRFCHTPGKVANGDTGDVACDHYHRLEQDLDLMAELGLNAYRFSVAWPRILPEGTGQPNPAGLDFYRRLVHGLRDRGIRPMATLYHWDLPQALQDRGGWADRDTAQYFADYADVVFRALGDAVPLWVTHNEPWVAAFVGHAFGEHAPGENDWPKALKVSHHLLLSHGLAFQAFRATLGHRAAVGLVLNLAPVYPATDRPEDAAAARRLDAFLNRWCLDPAFRGAYPAELSGEFERNWGFDAARPGDLDIIRAPIDFLGVNYYTSHRVRANPESALFGLEMLPPQNPVTAMGWEVTPEGLHDLLVGLKADYGDVPLYLTENGAAYPDQVGPNHTVDDPERVEYLRAHLAAAHRAITAGVDLRGYFVWSLLDNFEWAHGYARRFGLVYVDYATQARIPKRSAWWYRDVVARNGLEAPESRRAGSG